MQLMKILGLKKNIHKPEWQKVDHSLYYLLAGDKMEEQEKNIGFYKILGVLFGVKMDFLE